MSVIRSNSPLKFIFRKFSSFAYKSFSIKLFQEMKKENSMILMEFSLKSVIWESAGKRSFLSYRSCGSGFAIPFKGFFLA
ncbi:hypothetical protein CH380_16855 [Leptospira adleri]|uniref:Uncharacterized protein n=1 Tax=Leptospira adleri TaxID=2023186 RepID=A0A2M9YKP0_9LEPT|nr:hypothetical protein CH380_16855 [Leptospira adleri]PJZ62967.1 hypothetical protein CH376_05635 [Leptospira adleri]